LKPLVGPGKCQVSVSTREPRLFEFLRLESTSIDNLRQNCHRPNDSDPSGIYWKLRFNVIPKSRANNQWWPHVRPHVQNIVEKYMRSYNIVDSQSFQYCILKGEPLIESIQVAECAHSLVPLKWPPWASRGSEHAGARSGCTKVLITGLLPKF